MQLLPVWKKDFSTENFLAFPSLEMNAEMVTKSQIYSCMFLMQPFTPPTDFSSLKLHPLLWPKIISKLHISPLNIKLKFYGHCLKPLVPDNLESAISTALARNTSGRKQEPLKPDRFKSYLPAFLFPFTHLIFFLPFSSLDFRGTKKQTSTSNCPSLSYAKYLLVWKQRTNNNKKSLVWG